MPAINPRHFTERPQTCRSPLGRQLSPEKQCYFLLSSAQHKLDRVREKQIVRVNRLPFNCRVYHFSFKENELWKMEIHKLSQTDERERRLCTNTKPSRSNGGLLGRKSRQKWKRYDIRDLVTRRNVLCLTAAQ